MACFFCFINVWPLGDSAVRQLAAESLRAASSHAPEKLAKLLREEIFPAARRPGDLARRHGALLGCGHILAGLAGIQPAFP
jgi:hypothetical protein